jgi:hypothetical protein
MTLTLLDQLHTSKTNDQHKPQLGWSISKNLITYCNPLIYNVESYGKWINELKNPISDWSIETKITMSLHFKNFNDSTYNPNFLDTLFLTLNNKTTTRIRSIEISLL